jgi:thiosulfate/3-mercaptopyruvate sulfurtransferase
VIRRPFPLLLAAAVLLASPAASRASIGTLVPASAEALLVDVAWLAEHIDDPQVVLLHVGERGEYDREHLPGARFVTQSDLALAREEGEGALYLELPPADVLRRTLEGLGISDDSRVVVYYGNDWVSPATRVVFSLDYAGLGGRTSLLNGGMKAWKRAGKPVTAARPAIRRGRLTPAPTRPIVVDAEWVRAHAADPGNRLIDARAPIFYDGPPHADQRAGHIPGARNLPFSEVADDSVLLRSPVEMRALFAAAGVQPGDTVVAYCHIGQQATAVLFAARTLGHPVRLYDGSFQDWSRRAELPVEGGRAARPGDAREHGRGR